MEKKKASNRTYGKQIGKKAQNPAQQLAKQRLQRDMQKKLLETRKKAKEQTKQETEEDQTPETDAVTRLEQFAEQIFSTSSIHRGKRGKKSSISAQETHFPHNAKTSDSHAVPVRSSCIKSELRSTKAQNHMAANSAMKRWVQQRMVVQKQKMRMETKVKMQISFVEHIKPETTVEQILPPARTVRPNNITTQLLKAPVNQYAPNTIWAHAAIQKKQAEFRQKYWLSKANSKKDNYEIQQVQKNTSATKWMAPKQMQEVIHSSRTSSSSVFPLQQKSPISPSPAIPTSAVPSFQKEYRQNILPSSKSVKRTSHNKPSISQTRTDIKATKAQQTISRIQRARFIDNSQKTYLGRALLRHSSPPLVKNIWQGIRKMATFIRQITSNAGIWAIISVTLLIFFLLFGAVSGLVTSPFGVFFSSLETSPEARSVRAAITETNNEYFNRLDDLIRNTAHDTLVIQQIPEQQANDTQIHNWEEILAVFAVHTTTDPQTATDVVKLDNKRIQRLKDIFWRMVSIEHDTHTTGTGDDKKTTLTITITTKSADQMADELHFSKVQKGALDELLVNRAWLTELIGQATGSDIGHGSGDYQIPPEALVDEKFKAMITEAEKYLGYPYVWGGSSPSTSFDCSGFVSWVINKSGVGNVGRQTAQGLYDLCTPVSKAQAKPGDLVFFTGTYKSAGPVSHIGIFVGDGKMIHCGNPIQYTSIETSYWQKHFYNFGRI